MAIHKTLSNAREKLGYHHSDGICHGASISWLEAGLSGNLKKFSHFICSSEHLNKEIGRGKNLTELGNKLWPTFDFYDGLSLFLMPASYDVFAESPHLPTQHDIEVVSEVASSDAIKALGGLKQVVAHSFIYNRQEIKQYLDNLAVIFEQASISIKEPIGLLLSGYCHTVSLLYTPGLGWNFFNINDDDTVFFTKTFTSSQLAYLIELGFLEPKATYKNAFNRLFNLPLEYPDSKLSFRTSVVLTGSDLRQQKLQHQLENYIGRLSLTSEYTEHSMQNLVKLLVTDGNSNLLKQVKQLGININQHPYEGAEYTTLAAQHGQADVLSELVSQGIDINQPDIDGYTPAYYAAKYGHVDVIKQLVALGANLNREHSENGFSPAMIAAAFGRTQMLVELAKQGVDLNRCSSNGYSPIIIAAEYGYVDTVAELVNQGVSINATGDGGITAAIAAARAGTYTIFGRLVELGADLNQAAFNGKTPACSAAEKGHTEVITQLVKYGANLNQAMNDGSTPLSLAIKCSHPAVVSELIKKGARISINLTWGQEFNPKGNAPINQFITLFSAIDKLAQYGAKLASSKNQKTIAEGEKASEVAQNLSTLAHQYLIAHLAENKANQAKFSKKFNTALTQSLSKMNTHRAFWKPLLINIAIAATGIGLLLITAKLLTSRTMFFANTKRCNQLSIIADDFKRIPFRC